MGYLLPRAKTIFPNPLSLTVCPDVSADVHYIKNLLAWFLLCEVYYTSFFESVF